MGATLRVAHVSTFPPLHCGIASFAADLVESLPSERHFKYALHYGRLESPDVTGAANVNSPEELAAMSLAISASDCDVVCLQHEFGIWGGREGEHLLSFLDVLQKPLVSVLHTTFGAETRSALQARLIDTLVQRSARVVVLTERSRETLERLLGGGLSSVSVVAHGVPAVSYVAPPSSWGSPGSRHGSAIRLITPGYFREDKGIEAVLLAIWRLRRQGYPIFYTIAGGPQIQFSGQEGYFEEIKRLIKDLNLGSVVSLDGRYLLLDEQIGAIREAHLGVFAYQEPAQSSSGTVPLVLATGRPVLCTPFEYALTKRSEIPGVFVAEKFGAPSIANTLKAFLVRTKQYRALTEEVFAATRGWTWHSVGRAYLREYQRALSGPA